ncbi:MAG TPA: LAGLIDADG family homing endonuclease [Streptosporangiaceae bacterium]|jgi:hypothetical protein|nr:LAGLIDADG family homing endonuclease [Streptosporangiaceae bacterium]
MNYYRSDAMFDLRDPACAYIFGFMQADGHHYAGTRRRGSITIEIKATDVGLLRAMQDILPWSTSITFRTRTTNFAQAHEAAVLALCSLDARQRLLELGLPTGRKSAIIAPPTVAFSHRDYLRGIWDADGSVGFTGTGMPFLSIVTASQELANFVCAEIKRITGASRTAKPNRRDGVMNVMLGNDPAAEFARWLYTNAAIALDRKRDAGLAVAAWARPAGMRARSSHRKWTDAEDAVVLRMPVREAARLLDRSEKSVNIRRWRIRNDAA